MIPAVVPLFLVAVGVVALVAAIAVLRSFGPGYRLARLLATTPAAPIDEAIGLAAGARPRYVKVTGRIDAEDEFEDDRHRPLVFRRRRLEVLDRRRWRALDDHREAVTFAIRDGLSAIEVDTDELADGLIVIPRDSVGVASDARDRVPSEIPDATPIRLRIEQVSSVEHAIVLGVPVPGPDGGAILTAAADRPLVLTTLEQPEAMRLLAGGGRRRPVLASALLAIAGTGVVVGSLWALVGGVR
jgi:hypothetical protein